MSTQQTETITVYSDYVCPFCYLGRESLSRYQADRETALEIDWQRETQSRRQHRPLG